MDCRQNTGLTVIGIWAVLVVVIAIVTDDLVALGLLGLCPGAAAPGLMVYVTFASAPALDVVVSAGGEIVQPVVPDPRSRRFLTRLET